MSTAELPPAREVKQKAAILLVGLILGAWGALWLDSRYELPKAESIASSYPTSRDSAIKTDRPQIASEPAATSASHEQLMRQALQAAGPDRARTMRVTASVWAMADPTSAVSFLSALPDRRDRLDLTVIALGAWAIQQPTAAVIAINDMLQSGFRFEGFERQLIEQIARQDPLAILENYAALTGSLAELGAVAAMTALAETDPASATRFLSLADSETRRRSWMTAIVRGWTRLDAYAAFDWVQGRSGLPDREQESLIFHELAMLDPVDALEFAQSRLQDSGSLRSAYREIMEASLGNAPQGFAEQLMQTVLETIRTDQLQYALVPMLDIWLDEEPDAMLSWLANNSNRIPDVVFSGIAFEIRQSGANPERAAAYIDSIPEAARANWIEQIGIAYAVQLPVESAAWTERFRGSPDYAIAVLAVAEELARRYPEETVALLDSASLPAEVERRALQAAVSRWADTDPAALRDWALRNDNPARLAAVAPRVVKAWAATDIGGATAWALRLPSSLEKDQSLAVIIAAGAETSIRAGRTVEPDPRLLDAFSSDLVQQQLMMRFAAELARRDEDGAREFADAYLTDPGVRQTLEEIISRGQL